MVALRSLAAPFCFLAVAWPMFASSARADPGGFTSGSAAELTRQGREHLEAGDEAVATQRFAEALQLDPTYGAAYLELAKTRERAGDWQEAERTYSVAIAHIPEFVEAYRARGSLLGRLGEPDREISDLGVAARLSRDPVVLRELAARYVALRAWPAALTTWRKVRELSLEAGDARAAREASLQVRALGLLCAELDPVASRAAEPTDWVRRAEAAIAKRLGL